MEKEIGAARKEPVRLYWEGRHKKMIENATYYDTPASRFEKSPKLASVYDLVSIVVGNGSDRAVNEFMETYVGGDDSRCLIEDVDYHDLLSIPGI